MIPRRLLFLASVVVPAIPTLADGRATRPAGAPVLPGGLLLTLPDRAENDA
jgi:phage tail protein X